MRPWLITFALTFHSQDLPEELQKKLISAGVTLEEAEKNLACTLSILHFIYKRRFKLKKVKVAKEEEKEGESEVGEGEEFENAVQAEVLDGPDQPPTGTSSPSNSSPQPITNEITLEDLAREARTITDGDPLALFTKFVSHGQGYVSQLSLLYFRHRHAYSIA